MYPQIAAQYEAMSQEHGTLQQKVVSLRGLEAWQEELMGLTKARPRLLLSLTPPLVLSLCCRRCRCCSCCLRCQ